MMLLRAIKSDLYRVKGCVSVSAFIGSFLLNRNFRAIFSMRLSQYLSQEWWGVFLLPLAKIFHRVNCSLAAIDLPWNLQVGSGFCINHGWGLVINPRVQIGSNVTVFHGVTLGQADKIDRNGKRETFYPVINDNVWIGPHAIVVGNVKVGQGARVLGGSVVTKDVPDSAMVAGVPAKIIADNVPPDVMNMPT